MPTYEVRTRADATIIEVWHVEAPTRRKAQNIVLGIDPDDTDSLVFVENESSDDESGREVVTCRAMTEAELNAPPPPDVTWRLITADTPRNVRMLLYFPAIQSDIHPSNNRAAMTDVDTIAGRQHRPPTHFAIIGEPK